MARSSWTAGLFAVRKINVSNSQRQVPITRKPFGRSDDNLSIRLKGREVCQ